MEWLWKTQNNWNLIEFGVGQRTSVYKCKSIWDSRSFSFKENCSKENQSKTYYSSMWINACLRNIVESTSNKRPRKRKGRKKKEKCTEEGRYESRFSALQR